METESDQVEYVGFWLRVWATLIDAVLLLLICWPLLIWIYGWEYFDSEALVVGPADFIISWLLPDIAIVILWIKYQATPGKFAIKARVLDARTQKPASVVRYIIRLLGCYISALPIGLGFIWVAFDKRKQGWHDKMANTVVVRYPLSRQNTSVDVDT